MRRRRCPMTMAILTINCGSSSLKFALYLAQRTTTGNLQETLRYIGAVERIGAADSVFHVADGNNQPVARRAVVFDSQQQALEYTLDWLEQQPGNQTPDAVGHRIVHGGAAYEQP